MNRFVELFCRPLPHLTGGKALLLRLLMAPNLLLAEVEGTGRLVRNASSPCIYAFNHNNVFESLFVPVLLIWLLGGERVSFVIDWMFGRLPLVGWLMKQIDPIYVWHKRSTWAFLERRRVKAASSSSRDECVRRLRAGASIGIFPEGTRNGDPFRLLKARPGIGSIALESGVPVIPVGIEFIAARRRGRMPLVGKIALRFGEPMRFERHRASVAASGGDRALRRRVAGEIADEVMLAISSLCGKSYPYTESEPEPILTLKPSMEALCPS
ncbi:1-acyl-sn-glycerol-3-phosphate acyltransferase [Chlorobaculum thiosulfatiphilum]|uniref:1-acyl-sn-glycerol-3-phosphate acyltransferase n=1 Tax=Chlorobaculum thiosulfatiphilum TaxID=115852 RepID=A0A5C4SA18_CHLTI|nr:lysophospholipid acyltransferase family protein [Chlorobaculum thiosulfatiphilum]TNJ40374.1 1-acyl-sn-glycerol-3-phosphate acyltransferase [Chlorobaculum thiosulfatiphilum]